jgi:hypothetical protein
MSLRSRHAQRAAALLLSLVAAALLSSCAHRLGWGVVLWSAPEGAIPAGSVVPVYIRSNIDKVYVVGSLDGKKKLELPLWQLELFPSKKKARARLAELGPNASLYLIASRDGLPVRDAPTNSGNRVFRLRDSEAVKILAKVDGEKVETGGVALPGDWYSVMAGDGTRGYVFSATMRLFDESKEGSLADATKQASEKAPTVQVDVLFSKTWRPEYFQTMIDDGRIDLDAFSQRYGFFSDSVHRQLRIELPSESEVFNYTSISQNDGEYVFEGTPLRLRFDGDSRLTADWSAAQPSPPGGAQGEAQASAAVPAAAEAEVPGASAQPAAQGPSTAEPGQAAREASFVILSTDLRDAIRAEETRRQKLLDAFLAGGSDWALPSGSRLSLSRGKRFSWSGLSGLPEGTLPASFAAEADSASGELAFRLYLPPALSSRWEGSFSLRSGSGAWADFLYRHEGGDLILQPVGKLSGLEVESASSRQPLRFVKGTH